MKRLLLLLVSILSFYSISFATENTITVPITVYSNSSAEITIIGEHIDDTINLIDGQGTYNLEYNDVGEYIYTISQKGNDLIYNVHVIILYENGLSYTITVNRDNTKVDKIEFYSNCQFDTPIEKIVRGNPKEDLEFTFRMRAISTNAGYDIQDMPMPEGSINGEKTHTLKGEGSFEFGNIIITKPGSYTYQITEDIQDLDNWIFSSEIYTLKIEVDTEFNLTKTIIDSTNTIKEKCIFINEYIPPIEETTTVEPTIEQTTEQQTTEESTAIETEPSRTRPDTPPDTGDNFPLYLYISGIIIPVSVLGIIVSRKKNADE